MTNSPKKLIEVALPLEAINVVAAQFHWRRSDSAWRRMRVISTLWPCSLLKRSSRFRPGSQINRQCTR